MLRRIQEWTVVTWPIFMRAIELQQGKAGFIGVSE
jgi:hypothetical protein